MKKFFPLNDSQFYDNKVYIIPSKSTSKLIIKKKLKNPQEIHPLNINFSIVNFKHYLKYIYDNT